MEENSFNFINYIFRVAIENLDTPETAHKVLWNCQRYLNDGLVSDFPEVISLMAATSNSSEQDFLIVIGLLNFGSLIAQFPGGNKAVNMELALSAYEQLRSLASYEMLPDAWPTLVRDLGNVYLQRSRGNRSDNVEVAISLYQEALELTSYETNLEEYIGHIVSIAGAYLKRIKGESRQNAEVAIKCCNQALQLLERVSMPTEWVRAMIALGLAYTNRSDSNPDIERGITAYESILRVISPETHPADWAMVMSNLGLAYTQLTGERRTSSIEQAISIRQTLLETISPEDSPYDWAESKATLANAYMRRIKGERAENVETAIDLYKQALRVQTREAAPCEWAFLTSDMGLAYINRIKGGRTENIRTAISLYRGATEVITKESDPDGWVGISINLGNAYSLEKDSKYVDFAIATYQELLCVVTKESFPKAWAVAKVNLANAYQRKIREGKAENPDQTLEKAITLLEESLEVRTYERNPYEWARVKEALVNAYRRRMEKDPVSNKKAAIAACNAALAVITRDERPKEWAELMESLGNVYVAAARFEQGESSVEKAITAYEEALEVALPERNPMCCRNVGSILGNIYYMKHQWSDAVSAYQKAVRASDFLYRESPFQEGRDVQLRESRNLLLHTAYAQAATGDLKAAVVSVEKSRARRLDQIIEQSRMDTLSLEEDVPEEYQNYKQAVETLKRLESNEKYAVGYRANSNYDSLSTFEVQQQSEFLRQRIDRAITAIRRHPNHGDFLKGWDYEDVEESIQAGEPVLIFLPPTPDGSLVLVLNRVSQPDERHGTVEVSSIRLNSWTDESVTNILKNGVGDTEGWLSAYAKERRQVEKEHSQEWLETIDNVTRHLWDLVMEPIVSHLSELKVDRAVLITTGWLSFLPLHAAWVEDEENEITGRSYALDKITFTYSPNVRSLKSSRKGAAKSVVRSILAINEPGSGSAKLKYSEHEVNDALTHFSKHKIMREEEASCQAVMKTLANSRENYEVLHFACHGHTDFAKPLESSLLLSDGHFFMENFFNLRHQTTRLAVLSACETGLIGTELPDEVVSLPTAFIHSGAAGVIASLWKVSDASTALLVSKFYEIWSDNNYADSRGALREAQIWLRDSTVADIRSSSIGSSIGLRFLSSKGHPYAHPYHWSAFSYTGV